MKATGVEYFFITIFGFLIWSLLAGALLPLEERYIGMCLTSLGVVILYLYCYNELVNARSIPLIDAIQIKRFKYEQLQVQALKYRKLSLAKANNESVSEVDNDPQTVIEEKKKILTVRS